MDCEEDFPLLAGETLIMKVKPHFLAFYDMYFVWVWVIVVSLAFMAYGEQVSAFMDNPFLFVTGALESFTSSADSSLLSMLPLYSEFMGSVNSFVMPLDGFLRSYSAVGLWTSALIFSALVVSVFKIQWKWLLMMAAVGVASPLLALRLGMPAATSYNFGIMFALLGILGVEAYRRSHNFYLTDMRIVTEVCFIDHKSNEISYDKINNLVLEQDIFGRLFGFGTLIPVTASGVGMGSDFSAVTVGAAGKIPRGPFAVGAVTGGRSIQTPRTRSMYAVFGVPDPEKVQAILSEHIHEFVEAPYLRSIDEKLDALRHPRDRNDW